MHLNTSHAEYNLTLELLCLLSRTPAPLPCLAVDLMASIDDVLRLAKDAHEAYGLRLLVRKSGDGTIRVDHRDIPRLRKLALTYWSTVYGDPQ